MLPLPGKHTAFVFSDAAGANACMAYAKICQQIYHVSPLLFSNKTHGHLMKDGVQLSDGVPPFESFGLDCVFTGTSHPNSSNYYEVRCLNEAHRQKIKTISFVDHWGNFKLRFTSENGEQVYPDEIWVVDEEAKKLALGEGLPAEKLQIRPNPYLEFLACCWEPSFAGKTYLEKLGIEKQGYHILFAPDPLSLRNGKEVAGFTEDEALVQIARVVEEQHLPVHLLIKCHPLQPAQVLENVLLNTSISYTLIQQADTWELIHASDLVLGFYSNILLEASVMKKNVLRYFPGHQEADWLRHKTSLKKLQSSAELAQELNNAVYG